VANLWAGGSSFLVFLLAARSLSNYELGLFALAIAVVQLLVYLSDLGLTALVMREIARTQSLGALKWNLRRRCLVIALAVVPVVFATAGDFGPGVVVLVLLTALANSWYSAVLAALFSLQRNSRVLSTQFVNGMCFTLLGLAVFLLRPALVTYIGVFFVSYVFLLLGNFHLLRQTVQAEGRTPSLVGQLPFVVSGVASGIGSSGDSLLLGSQSKMWLAQYASAQRAGLGVAAASRAASNLLLPRFTRAPAHFDRRRLVTVFAVLCGCGGLMGAAVTPAANFVYGSDLVAELVLALLFAAYMADVLLVSLSANLIAKGMERGLAVVACVQLSTMLLGAVIFLQHGPAAVAAAVLAGRIVAFGCMVWLESRGLNRRGFDAAFM
jgi:O-antigen/teichoic acid export membrane protein